MATSILSSVFMAAKAVAEVIQVNALIRDEERELRNVCEVIMKSVEGLKDAGGYVTALNSMVHYLNEARKIMETMNRRRERGSKWYLAPKAQLLKIRIIQEKLMRMVQLLGMAFGAEQARNQGQPGTGKAGGSGAGTGGPDQKAFDATQIITHVSAKKFWRKHIGADMPGVPWARFKLAFKAEYRTNLQSTLL